MSSSRESRKNSRQSRTGSRESRRSSGRESKKNSRESRTDSRENKDYKDYKEERSMEGRIREGEERTNTWHPSSPLNPRNFQILSSLLELM